MKTVIDLTVLAGVLAFSYGGIQTPDYDDTPNPEFLNPSWMASLPDDQLLSGVTMPGTHNTMSRFGGAYAECQSWSLASQLRAGVRFLDIRVRHVRGNLTIHHGVSYQRAHFGEVLEGVADFLREHPSETVLMRIQETFSETNDIYGAVVDYIHRYAHWDLLWHSRLVPTMAEVRGKIIILQDFSGPDLGMRYDSLDIADDWKVPTLLHVEEKWKSVYEHLEAAPAGNMAQIFLTYSSGAGVFAYPRALARLVNAHLYDYLKAKTDSNQRFGIICMDFPAAPIIKMIIEFQLKEMGLFFVTDMKTSQRTRFTSLSPVQIAAIVVGNIICWMLMLAAIGLGATHLSSCPLQPNIPVYLVVLGAASLIALSVIYTRKNWDGCTLSSTCSISLHLFIFCWLVAGSVWVYPLYPPNFTPRGQYCHRTTYQFAFVVTTIMWVSLLLFVVFTGLLISCKMEATRSRLMCSRYAFYGATSCECEPTAGDV